MHRCPLVRLSGLQCYNMGHNVHGINLYGVIMTIMGHLHTGGQSSFGHLGLLHRTLLNTLYPLLTFPHYKQGPGLR